MVRRIALRNWSSLLRALLQRLIRLLTPHLRRRSARITLVGAGFCLLSSSVSAFWVELFDPRDGQFDVSQILAKDLGFLPVPILITEPAIGFGGLGQTADAIGNLGSDGTEKTVGGGFRYLIARRLGLRTGIDVARGPEEWTLYFQVGNAW